MMRPPGGDANARLRHAMIPVVPGEICLDALHNEAGAAVYDHRLLVAGVADTAKPRSGDTLACFGFAADGTRLEVRVKPR